MTDEPAKRIFPLPHARNPHFIRRESELKQLHELFNLNEPPGQGNTVAVTGLEGVGKTALAVEYCYRFGEEYDTILWLRAGENLTSQYAGIADLLGLDISVQDTHDRIVGVKRWLKENQKWLLVFDNAPNQSEIEEFLPRGKGGDTLITLSGIGDRTTAQIALAKWDKATSVEYILKRLPKFTPQEAETLTKWLGHLPLVLEIATRYFEHQPTHMNTYLHGLNGAKETLLESGNREISDTTMAQVCYLSYVAVAREVNATLSPRSFLFLRRQKLESATEMTLLSLLSSLSPEAMPRALFRDKLLEPETSQMDIWLETLAKYSLIQLDDQSVSIHPLVQEALRCSPACPAPLQSLRKTETALYYSDSYSKYRYEVEGRLQEPHWQRYVETMKERGYVSSTDGWLYHKYGDYLNYFSRYSEAEPLLKQAIQQYRRTPTQYTCLPSCLMEMVYLCYYQRRFSEAEHYCEEALEIRRQILPQCDLHSTLSWYANILLMQGYYAKAESLYEQVLDHLQQTLPEHHPDRIGTSLWLCRTYFAQNHFEKGISLLDSLTRLVQQNPSDEYSSPQQLVNFLYSFFSSWRNVEVAKVIQEHYPDLLDRYEAELSRSK